MSETTTGSARRFSGEDEESEDEDPWTDPWQWQRPPPHTRRSSSVYSDAARELKFFDEQDLHSRNPFVDEDQEEPKKLHSPRHVEKDQEPRKQDLELQVRNALRQSHSTTGNSELTHPPKAYSVLSRTFSLTPSDSAYRLSWLHSRAAQDDDEDRKMQRAWRGVDRGFWDGSGLWIRFCLRNADDHDARHGNGNSTYDDVAIGGASESCTTTQQDGERLWQRNALRRF
ncbi:uncharacterized protein MYCFIDRAFT_80655 [Pseudocercospora fijiensis CIRAD86]|uniref:Uncharacterized protein n=1 Tax=Pseudocercospora fijiensis (strain CIRAD86) TaxID=383855 RepID=M3B129_PSEFD|nr:uncharacterized protein MYCFIDRAFT_80655 [Pseudocercospora fijiensis CIRAD86]EME83098.1 hypothetical protein MYCFIDRAFT_80655 [Pseudocercospora fijiensis CIRAD86]